MKFMEYVNLPIFFINLDISSSKFIIKNPFTNYLFFCKCLR